jgi:MFS family permease
MQGGFRESAAPSLRGSDLLFFRVIQGLGGGMAPSEQAILADSFPPQLRPQAFRNPLTHRCAGNAERA